jgi:hypothetical protein
MFVAGLQFSVPKAAAQQAPWNAEARVQYFYDSLAPYGNWIWHAHYGWCWYPYNMAVDWRPYSQGHWEYTDYGWTWVSDYPWGWACFHYGRWFYDDSNGWLWWPDTVWAPSWVVWRTGGDWIGWAPCPPEAVWREGVGLTFEFGVFDDFFPSRWFCFVRRSHFIDRDLRDRIEMRARNVTIINETKATSNNLRFEHEHIVNRLPVQKELEKDIGHPITRLKLANAESPERSRVEGNEVKLFRPEVRSNFAGAGAPQKQRENIGEQPLVSPPVVVPSVPETQQVQEIKSRHADEMRALEESQVSRQRKLEQQHAQEIKSVSDTNKRQQLMQQQQKEIQAQKELMGQERKLIQQEHGREERMFTAPAAPPQRRFNLQQQTDTGDTIEERNAGSGENRGASRNEGRRR